MKFLFSASLIWVALTGSAVVLGQPAAPQVSALNQEDLSRPEAIESGKAIWNKRCKFCHGKTAYPGKAPKLDPAKYQPEYVYDRVTNGFRGMPAFKNEFSENERKAVVAYIMSRDFSN